MLFATPGLVLHTTPYAESSVVVKVFTRQLGVRSYIIKGVRGNRGRVKQNMLQPLSSIDMVVYDTPRTQLNHVRELSPRRPDLPSDPVDNALRFFMTEALYKSLPEAEPMPALWDYVEAESGLREEGVRGSVPIRFLLTVARHLGIEPLDNHSVREPWFDLQEGRFVGTATETALPTALSAMLHEYLSEPTLASFTLAERRDLLSALLAYYQLHIPTFRNFTSHEILHTILK